MAQNIMGVIKGLLYKSRHVFVYGTLMAFLVFVLKWLQWKYLVTDYSLEIYIGLVAVFFTILGIWVATQLTRSVTKTVIVEKEVHVAQPIIETVIVEKEIYKAVLPDSVIDEAELRKLNLTSREYEVLQLLTRGKSNAEIAEHLFLSVSTVKTHVSNLFVKMDVKSRIQAMEKARRLRITS